MVGKNQDWEICLLFGITERVRCPFRQCFCLSKNDWWDSAIWRQMCWLRNDYLSHPLIVNLCPGVPRNVGGPLWDNSMLIKAYHLGHNTRQRLMYVCRSVFFVYMCITVVCLYWESTPGDDSSWQTNRECTVCLSVVLRKLVRQTMLCLYNGVKTDKYRCTVVVYCKIPP
jgi:hypothetical protein